MLQIMISLELSIVATDLYFHHGGRPKLAAFKSTVRELHSNAITMETDTALESVISNVILYAF